MTFEPANDHRAERAAVPLVSLICTARNASATIARTIESVRRQTLCAWEMVVVDDGSSDTTAEVIRRYASIDPRIRLVPTAGIGRGRALNLAVAHARADLVANLDADDESHPQRLELQLAAFERFASPVVLSTAVRVVGGEQKMDARRHGFSIEDCRFTDVTRLLGAHNPVGHSSIMMRKRDLAMAGGYAETLASQFDYELWVRMVEHGCRIIRLEAPLTVMRWHPGQSFQRRGRLAYLRNSMRIQRRAIAACGVGRGYHALILARFAFGMLPSALRQALQPGLEAVAAYRVSIRKPAGEPDPSVGLEPVLGRSAKGVDPSG